MRASEWGLRGGVIILAACSNTYSVENVPVLDAGAKGDAGGSVDGSVPVTDSGAGGQGPDSTITTPACTTDPCTLATGGKSPIGIAVDSSFVYWTDNGAGTVSKAPLAGGSNTVLATGQAGPWQLALAGGTLYWANRANNTLMSMPVTGGTPTAIINGGAPLGVAASPAGVFWTNFGGVVDALLTGGQVTAIAPAATPFHVAVDGTSVYWTSLDFGNPANGGIYSSPLAGGAVTTIAAGQLAPTTIAVDSKNVYWTSAGSNSQSFVVSNGQTNNSTDGAIFSYPISGGATSLTTIMNGQASPFGIAVDATDVYWSYGAPTGGISRAPIGGGGGLTPLVLNQATPAYLAVDATSVYWTNFSDGTVMKKAK